MTSHRKSAWLVGVACCSALLGGCSETGDPAVYDVIEAETDCANLFVMLEEYRASEDVADESGDSGAQEEFRSYASAVERRQDALGCD